MCACVTGHYLSKEHFTTWWVGPNKGIDVGLVLEQISTKVEVGLHAGSLHRKTRKEGRSFDLSAIRLIIIQSLFHVDSSNCIGCNGCGKLGARPPMGSYESFHVDQFSLTIS